MLNDIKLSVIIVTYNCLPYLEKALSSIEKFNDLGNQLEVIVVDNGSDDSYKILKPTCNFKFQIFKNDNKGFGEGNNRGVEKARGKYILFLNPDTELIEPVFSKVTDFLDKNRDVGTVGVKLIDGTGKQGPTFNLRFRFGFIRNLMSKLLIKSGIYLQSFMFTSGAALFIRADLFKSIGGFDENFFLYCEESDISNRVNAAGFKTAYLSKLTIVHYEGKTEVSNLSKTYFRELKSWKYYCKKYSIDFESELEKELIYCRLKYYILSFLNRTESANQYKLIIDKCSNCDFINEL